jgi:hypothetical protein
MRVSSAVYLLTFGSMRPFDTRADGSKRLDMSTRMSIRHK